MTLSEARWSQFAGRLLGYISDGHNRFIQTDYEVDLDMSDLDILYELWNATSVEELSPELQRVAREYMEWEKRQKF